MDLLENAAAKLIDEHDFSAFGTPPQPGGSTIREILSASWKIEKENVSFEILGNAFLYHMVRRLVSYQVEIGLERRTLDEVEILLNGDQESMVQGLAPAKGLFLKEVRYPI
jgi:tRNA pseudouridine38-40 synthase